MSELEHIQAPIFEEGEVVFQVDEGLQSLIQLFRDTGIQTFNSCQDNIRGTCWIEFDLTDWIMLSDVSFKSPDQLLYRFIEESCEVLLLSSDDGHPDEVEVDTWIEGDELFWSASVRFPKERIADFEQIIAETIAIIQFEENKDDDTEIH